MSYGAAIISVRAPDRSGRVDDVVLGLRHARRLPDQGAVLRDRSSAVTGTGLPRDASRSTACAFQLAVNNGANHLHGGVRGFDKVVWKARAVRAGGDAGVAFTYTSADGEEGYPGTLTRQRHLHAHARQRAQAGLPRDHRQADADQPDEPQLLQPGGTRRRRHPRSTSSRSTRIGTRRSTTTQIPTGEIAAVAGTPFDFRTADRDWRADRCGRRTAPPRQRLRPQLRAERHD